MFQIASDVIPSSALLSSAQNEPPLRQPSPTRLSSAVGLPLWAFAAPISRVSLHTLVVSWYHTAKSHSSIADKIGRPKPSQAFKIGLRWTPNPVPESSHLRTMEKCLGSCWRLVFGGPRTLAAIGAAGISCGVLHLLTGGEQRAAGGRVADGRQAQLLTHEVCPAGGAGAGHLA